MQEMFLMGELSTFIGRHEYRQECIVQAFRFGAPRTQGAHLHTRSLSLPPATVEEEVFVLFCEFRKTPL
jgi:hypothetical protein